MSNKYHLLDSIVYNDSTLTMQSTTFSSDSFIKHGEECTLPQALCNTEQGTIIDITIQNGLHRNLKARHLSMIG